MAVAGTIDAPLSIFKGLVTDMAPADLPEGVSPDCQDVSFVPGSVKSRPGLNSVFAAIAGTPKVNYLKTYVTQTGLLRLLALDAAGSLWKESSVGVLSLISSSIVPGTYGKSASLFTREYLAVGDGKFGLDIPRQFDDTNLDRVSQDGPGNTAITSAGSLVADAVAESAFTIAASPNGAVRANGLSTITTTAAHGYNPGQLVTIAGVTDATFNGTFTILTVPSTTTFTYTQAAANSTSGAGTATLQPGFAAGVHKMSVCFKTRQGYITRPMPPTQWTSVGVRRANIVGLPIGPPNVIARIVLFTLAGQSSFFYLNSTIVTDNTTTSIALDIYNSLGSGEAALSAGINADALFNQVELGECSGVIDYSSRLFWWGERNKVQNFNNITFDGGAFLALPIPFGWSANVSTNGAVNTANAYWGGCWAMTGDGVSTNLAYIIQPAVTDINGVPILQPNTAYSIRVRLARLSTAFTQGTVLINFQHSGSQTIVGGGFSLACTALTTSYVEYIASILTAQATIPSDLVLAVVLNGPATNNATALVDCIEIFPTNQPLNTSLVRASGIENPESYDGLTGFLQVSENDGYAVRSAFVIRDNLYFVKEHGIYVTQDDGINNPNLWKVTEVSRKVGTLSVNGVAVGEDWAVIADRAGLFITDGGEPKKISQEIQPTWDRINWQFGFTIWVQVDTQNKRILVGLPLDSATSPNTVMMMDYRGLDTALEIAEYSPIHISYSGKLLVRELSRAWSPWTIVSNSGAIIERFDGTQKVFIGNGVGNGKIYQLLDSQLGSDDGVAIPSYYTTYFHFSHDIEQAFQMGSHNKLFTYMAQFVEGSGNNIVSSVAPGGSATVIASVPLTNPALRDTELPINVTATRSAFKVASGGNVGDWFRLARFVTNAIMHPSAPVRGWN